MPKQYSKKPENATKAVHAKGSNLRVHFKNTRETAMAIKGLGLRKAQKYLQDVVDHKQIVPFRRFRGGIGRKAQAKHHQNTDHQARWPEKSAKFLLNLLKNAESNAEFRQLKPEALEVVHVQVNQAPKMRRRTYRAHGRINAYMRSPCHIELILTEKEKTVSKPKKEKKAKAPAAEVKALAS